MYHNATTVRFHVFFLQIFYFNHCTVDDTINEFVSRHISEAEIVELTYRI